MSEVHEENFEEVRSEAKAIPSAKLKLALEVPGEHWLVRIQEQCKQRGVKNLDIGEVLLSALGEVPDSWWEEKLEKLTPLEFRVNAALADPDLREKLQALLVNQAKH